MHRLVIERSIEERLLAIQEAKTALGKGSFEKLTKKELAKAEITTFVNLFEVDAKTAHHWDAIELDDFFEGSDEENEEDHDSDFDNF